MSGLALGLAALAAALRSNGLAALAALLASVLVAIPLIEAHPAPLIAGAALRGAALLLAAPGARIAAATEIAVIAVAPATAPLLWAACAMSGALALDGMRRRSWR